MYPVRLLSILFVVLYNSQILLAKDIFASLGEMTKLADSGEKISAHLKEVLDEQHKVLARASK